MNNYKKPTLEIVNFDVINIIMTSTATEEITKPTGGYDSNKPQGQSETDFYNSIV